MKISEFTGLVNGTIELHPHIIELHPHFVVVDLEFAPTCWN